MYEEFPTGRYDGEEVSYNDWLLPFNDSAPPNFPLADHEAPLPLVSTDPPRSGVSNDAELSKDQYATRSFNVLPDGGAASAVRDVTHIGATMSAAVTTIAQGLCRFIRTFYDCSMGSECVEGQGSGLIRAELSTLAYRPFNETR